MTLARSTLFQRIRFELGDRPWEDSSCSAANATSTITGATTDFWEKGDVGEFVTDGDAFLVISETAGTITATRSYWGSTGAAHTTERVLKNPRFTFFEIANAVDSVVRDRLYPRAYKKVADTITPAASTTVWYDLAAPALGIIDARQLYGTSDTKEGRFGERHDNRSIILRRNMTTSLVASGVGVRFPGGFFHDSNTVNIDYEAKITSDLSGSNYSDFTAGDAVVEAIIFGVCAHLESAAENRKPRKPAQDRDTMRVAQHYENKFQAALAQAEQEMRHTIPRLREWSRGS